MAVWKLAVLFQLLLLSGVRCSIDGIIRAAEEAYQPGLLDDAEGQSPPYVWDNYRIPGSNDTFVKFQLDQLITKETYENVVNQEGEGLGRRRRNAVKDESKLWPGRVPYKIDGNFSERERLQILSAIQHWMAHTCIVFEPATADDFNMITFGAVEDVCVSVVGMMQGNQPINLAPGCRTKTVIIHEIGHALGLYHEHMRADRDMFVTINYDNINKTQHHNFYKLYNDEYNDYGKPYDYRSIMHYSKYAFSTDRSQKLTIVPTNSSFEDIIGTATEASFLDMKIVNDMYKCSAGCKRQDCPDGAFLAKGCECYCDDNGRAVKCNTQVRCKKPQIDLAVYSVYLRDFRKEVRNLNQPFPHGTILLAEFKDRACGDAYTRLTCIGGEWRGEVPKCLEEKSCGIRKKWIDEYIVEELGEIEETDDLPDNSTIIQDEEYYILSRHSIRVTCHEYPELSKVLTCESGKWSDAPMPCVIKDCKVNYARESLYSLYMDGERLENGAVVPHRAQVSATCDNVDYEWDETSAETNIICNNGVWEGNPPQNCSEGPKDCPLVVNSTVIGSFLGGYSVTCIHGYNINVPDTKTFKCSYFGEWEPARPYCEPADCVLSLNSSAATVSNNVGVQLSTGSIIEHGENVTITCPYGHFPDAMVITCHLGNWSTETGQLPQCKQVNCPRPPVTRGMRYRPLKKDYVYKDKVVVNKCRGNLEFYGDKEITCQQYGNWSGKAGCRKYCEKGIESYVDLKNKHIRAKPQRTIQPGRFRPAACKKQCEQQKRFLCMSVVYGFDERRKRYQCKLFKVDPTRNSMVVGDKNFWTVSYRTCKSSE